jgi:hypothetical protein
MSVLLASPTFWTGTVLMSVAATCCAVLLALLLRGARRRRLRSLHSDEAASAAALDMTLVFPIAVLIACVTVQFALLANASFVTHYAAYSAARAARVHLWNPRPIRSFARALETRERRLATLALINDGAADSNAFRAACLSLAAVAPSSGAVGREPAMVRSVAPFLQRLGVETRGSGTAVLRRKVGYSCRPSNTQVDVGITNLSTAGLLLPRPPTLIESLPVTAEVSYRYRLTLPPGALFGIRGRDGHYTRTLRAAVMVP